MLDVLEYIVSAPKCTRHIYMDEKETIYVLLFFFLLVVLPYVGYLHVLSIMGGVGFH